MRNINVMKEIERILQSDQELTQEVIDCLLQVRNGDIDEEWVNTVVQYGHYTERFDIYDAFILNRINKEIEQGRILYDVINVGSAPYKDHEVKENNEVLKDVPDPYIAEFAPEYGGGARDDGFLSHKEGSKFHNLKRIVNDRETVGKCYMPRLSLEVGTTSSFTTFKHAVYGHGVARWAYKSEKIYILVNAYPFSFANYNENVLKE